MILVCSNAACGNLIESEIQSPPPNCPLCGHHMTETKESALALEQWTGLGIFWYNSKEKDAYFEIACSYRDAPPEDQDIEKAIEYFHLAGQKEA